MPTDDIIFDKEEAANFLKISKKTLDRLELPRIILGKRRVGFWKSALLDYATKRTTETSQAKAG